MIRKKVCCKNNNFYSCDKGNSAEELEEWINLNTLNFNHPRTIWVTPCRGVCGEVTCHICCYNRERLLCRPCGILMVMLMIRHRWRLANHPMGQLPRGFWKNLSIYYL